MKGWLDADDTQFMNIGKGDFESGTIMYDYGEPDGAERAALIAKLEKKRISVNVDGAPSAKAEYEISLTVGQDKSGRIGREWRSGMQQKLEWYFETELARVFKPLPRLRLRCNGVRKICVKKIRQRGVVGKSKLEIHLSGARCAIYCQIDTG